MKLALSCKNLAVAETSGYQPPDPYAVLLASDSRGYWEEVSRTEILQNSRGTIKLLRERLTRCHLYQEIAIDGTSVMAFNLVNCSFADPEFETPLICTFLFEKPQRLKAVVLCKNKTHASGDDSSLGKLLYPSATAHNECTLHPVVPRDKDSSPCMCMGMAACM